jgi:hypothetical protein
MATCELSVDDNQCRQSEEVRTRLFDARNFASSEGFRMTILKTEHPLRHPRSVILSLEIVPLAVRAPLSPARAGSFPDAKLILMENLSLMSSC